MYYLGICILIWMGLGFLTGIKMVFVDRGLTQEKIDLHLEKIKEDERQVQLILFATKKTNFIAICTLLGGIVFYSDLVGTLKEAGNSIKNFKNRFKSKK